METLKPRKWKSPSLSFDTPHTRIIKRQSLVSLAASLERWGQLIPVITVGPGVLIDGYRRVAALKLCKQDTVLAECWSCGEDLAVLRILSSRAVSEDGRSWSRRPSFGNWSSATT